MAPGKRAGRAAAATSERIVDIHTHVNYHGKNIHDAVRNMDEQGIGTAWLLTWRRPRTSTLTAITATCRRISSACRLPTWCRPPSCSRIGSWPAGRSTPAGSTPSTAFAPRGELPRTRLRRAEAPDDVRRPGPHRHVPGLCRAQAASPLPSRAGAAEPGRPCGGPGRRGWSSVLVRRRIRRHRTVPRQVRGNDIHRSRIGLLARDERRRREP